MHDVSKKILVKDYQGPGSNAPNFGFSKSTYYFATVLENQSDRSEFVISIDYPHIDHVSAFSLTTNAWQQLGEGGDLQPFAKRYRPNRAINFHLTLPKKQKRILLIKAKTSGSMQLPLSLYSERAFGDHAAQENMGLGLYYGLMLVMIIYNLFLYLGLRHISYLYYSCYLGCFLVFQMELNGTAFMYFLPEQPLLINQLMTTFIFLAFYFLTCFVMSFLNLDQQIPKFNRFLVVFRNIILLHGLLSPMPFSSYKYFITVGTAIAVVLPILFLLAGLICLKNNYRSARFFTLAFVVFNLGISIYGLKTFGLLPNVFITAYAGQIGSKPKVFNPYMD